MYFFHFEEKGFYGDGGQDDDEEEEDQRAIEEDCCFEETTDELIDWIARYSCKSWSHTCYANVNNDPELLCLRYGH